MTDAHFEIAAEEHLFRGSKPELAGGERLHVQTQSALLGLELDRQR